MQPNLEQHACQNPKCDCRVGVAQSYCSAHCRQAGEAARLGKDDDSHHPVGQARCQCGHVACNGVDDGPDDRKIGALLRKPS